MVDKLDLDELWEREHGRRWPSRGSLLATAAMFAGLAMVIYAAVSL